MHALIPLLLACTGDPVRPPPGDTGADTAGTGDTAGTPEWADQAWVEVQTLPADRGLNWQIDEDFRIESVTVPTLLVTASGEYRMFLSVMNESSYGAISMMRSTDGVSWPDSPEVIIGADQFGGECGDAFADVGVIYLDDGSFRLLLEGYGTGDDPTRRFCSAVSDDGDTWTPETGIAYAGAESDYGSLSVPEVLRMPDGRWFLYYVGNLPNIGEMGSGDSIRLAVSEDGRNFTPLIDENMLPSHDTDPWPLRLDDGSMRLYHTHPVNNGRIAASDSPDGLSFETSTYLDGLDLDEPSEELWLDPTAAHLSDGRLVLYFTRLLNIDGELLGTAIGRAWALD